MKSVHKNFKFKGMRKEQSFIFYPCNVNDKTILIQSSQRIARINLEQKTMVLSKGRSSGSYNVDLCSTRGAKIIELTQDEMATILQGRDEMAGITNPDKSINLLG